MDHQWFWQTAGEEYGPLSTDELENLVRGRRVKDDDQIRLDGSADWLPAAQVKAMFGAADSAGPETGAQAAARVLAGIDRRQLEREADEATWGARFAALVGKGASGPAGVMALFRDWLAAGLARLLGLFSKKAALAVVVVLLLAILFKNVEIGDTQTDEIRERLAQSFDEMQSMKKRKASQAEWNAFENDTLEWLEPAVEELGESANRNEAAFNFGSNSRFNKAMGQKSLIGAAGILKETIAQAGRPSQTEKPAERKLVDKNGKPLPGLAMAVNADPPELLFSKRMDMATAFFSGEIKTGGTVAGSAKAPHQPVDPLMVGIVVVDIGLVAGGLAFWWRRRKASGAV